MRLKTEYRRSEPGEPFERKWAWRGGAVAGFVATVVMGLAITLMQLSALRVAIAGLYGFEGSLVVGWAAHLIHGSLFGAVFAAILADPGLYRVSEWVWKTVVAGVVYGLVLAVIGAGIVMPIWLGVVGVPMASSIPNVTVPLLVWHVIYGLVLGGLFPFVEEV